MGVRNSENFQYALERAILAWAPVQHVESDVGFDRGQYRCDVTTDVDARHPVAEPRQRLSAGLAGAQRYFALGGPASHPDGDVLAHLSSVSAAALIRLYHSTEPRLIDIEPLGGAVTFVAETGAMPLRCA